MTSSDKLKEASFFQALATEQLEDVRSMVLEQPSLLDAFDDRQFGATPLTMACFANRRNVVELLLDLGADPNRRSRWKMGPWSPLHCALFRCDQSLAQYLLQRGAELDVHTAAGLGLLPELQELLDAQPERVHERGGDGCFPLHFAASTEVADVLLARGAPIDGRCIDHFNAPAQYLCLKRPEVAIHLFDKGASIDLFSAILAGSEKYIAQALDKTPDWQTARIDQSFFPPSAEHDVHNILTFVVGYRATPLHTATIANRGNIIQLLIDRGASPHLRGGYDDATPLHLAAWNDLLEAAQALCEHGADLNVRSGKIHNNSPAAGPSSADRSASSSISWKREPSDCLGSSMMLAMPARAVSIRLRKCQSKRAPKY
ncbi:MAG: ankyrin repeat domain-containing protein [Pirellulales bacterium]